MKNLLKGLLAATVLLAATYTSTKAQVSLSVNIGTWTPPPAYSTVNYYYLPEVESYYYAPTRQYVYLDGGNWVWRRSLPVRYNTYNINNGYKVAVYRDRPYRYFNNDRTRYVKYRGYRGNGVVVRDRYVSRPRVINRTHYVARPRVVNRTRYVSRPRVVNHTRVVNRVHVVNRGHGGHGKH
ncbi:hypothetical protein [Mucilaginibacter gynuensis]